MKSLTVGELKEALENVPNDTIVKLTSDTGVDQGQCGGKIVIESAHYTHYSTDEYTVDYFGIYANEVEED